MTERRRTRVWAVLGVLAFVPFAGNGRAQEQPTTTQSTTPTLKTGITYEDQSSESCEKQNENNPYTGMDPLTCYGVMAPTDSRGECSLGGMQVWKHVGNTCYYCSPISSPPNTIIVPMDQVGAADNQGFRCGVDQADACMAICSGGSTYSPPPGTVVEGGGPGLPPTPVPPQGGPPAGADRGGTHASGGRHARRHSDQCSRLRGPPARRGAGPPVAGCARADHPDRACSLARPGGRH